MPRTFNTAGLCFPEDHYMIDPIKRLGDVINLIRSKKYFVIHAPRQTGKTTAMRALMKKINNIKDKSLTLQNFSKDEVQELYNQHTEETGQVFEKPPLEMAYYFTQGQPWLVNALARECVEQSTKAGTTLTITDQDIKMAKEAIILRRDTHLDSLIEKLNEKRVRRVLEPILAGNSIQHDITDDEIMYVCDLGLVTKTPSMP